MNKCSTKKIKLYGLSEKKIRVLYIQEFSLEVDRNDDDDDDDGAHIEMTILIHLAFNKHNTIPTNDNRTRAYTRHMRDL